MYSLSGGFGLCPQPRGYLYASRPVLRTTLQICVAFSGGIASLRPRLLPRTGRNRLKVHTLRSTIPRTKKKRERDLYSRPRLICQ